MADESHSILDSVLRRRRRRTILRALAAVAVLVGIAAFFWLRGQDELPEPISPSTSPLAEAEPVPPPAPEPVPDLVHEEDLAAAEARPLPSLGESDPLVRRIAATVSSRPEVLVWLASDELIRRFVASVDAIAEGQSAVDQIPTSMRPKGKFEVVASGDGEIAAPAAYARYDSLAEVVSGLDSRALVRAYRELQPLVEEAYRDLGHPKDSFDSALRAAIFELLSTPTLVGQPPLERLTQGYGYADPVLEDLPAAQKQLLRFGPENAPRVQRKLRELAIDLGIPESELPTSRIFQTTG